MDRWKGTHVEIDYIIIIIIIIIISGLLEQSSGVHIVIAYRVYDRFCALIKSNFKWPVSILFEK